MKNSIRDSVILICVLLAAGCGANDSVLRSGRDATPRANTAPEVPTLAKDLESMRTAGFTFIYVLRRKDGAAIDPEDRSVIRAQTAQANRRVSSDEGKAVIIGSNFQLSADNMAAIYQRFAVENYSPAPGQNAAPLPPASPPANVQ